MNTTTTKVHDPAATAAGGKDEDVTIEELVEISGAGTAGTAGTVSTPATIGTAGSFSCF